ncbi:rRNA maturation RNase YbeY [Bacteroidota bacterium]
MIKNLSINTDAKFTLQKRLIHSLVNQVKEELNISINYLLINFINSSYIRSLNKKYLEHDYTTDIITFNYSGENDNLDGEIFISYADAKENSRKYKVTLGNEIIRLVVHGILHLAGYDDETPGDKKKMKKLEDELVKKYGKSAKKLVLKYDW